MMYAVADLKPLLQNVIQQVNKAYFPSYIEAHNAFGYPGASVIERMRKLYPSIVPKKTRNLPLSSLRPFKINTLSPAFYSSTSFQAI
jgi:hypothetical protein